MASNSPFSRSSTSSLLRSAGSTAAVIADYQDKIKAFEWGNSAYTDSAFGDYSQYLQDRITKLQATGTLADASKALTLMGTLKSATHSNISASIQRENIQIMAGGATLPDKYNVISQQFQRAIDNGDLTLAQSLETQAYSVSQQIQYQQQQATAAAISNGNAARSASVTGEQNAAKNLKQQLDDFNTSYTHAGAKSLDKATADFTKSITPTLNALGVYFAPDVKPNYFDLVDGVTQAISAHYLNEATIWNGVDQQKYTDAIQKAQDTLNGIKTAFGTMNYSQLQQAQADPGQFHLKTDPEFAGKGLSGGAGGQNPQTGYTYNYTLDAHGNPLGVQPTFSHNPAISVPADAANQINALGLQVVSGTAGTNGVQVIATNGRGKPGDKNYVPPTPDYIKKVLPADTATHLVYGPAGVQFEADAGNGGKTVYSLVKDANGKQALFGLSDNVDPLGNHFQKLLGNDKGFNPYAAPGQTNTGANRPGFFDKLGGFEKNVLHSATSGISSAASSLFGFGGHASASDVISGAQSQVQIAQANAAAARAMVSQPAPVLPPISIAPPPAPAPLAVNNTPGPQHIVIPTHGNPAIAPKTVNPQGGGTSVQAPNYNLQGGGGSIRLQ